MPLGREETRHQWAAFVPCSESASDLKSSIEGRGDSQPRLGSLSCVCSVCLNTNNAPRCDVNNDRCRDQSGEQNYQWTDEQTDQVLRGSTNVPSADVNDDTANDSDDGDEGGPRVVTTPRAPTTRR